MINEKYINGQKLQNQIMELFKTIKGRYEEEAIRKLTIIPTCSKVETAVRCCSAVRAMSSYVQNAKPIEIDLIQLQGFVNAIA